LISTSQSSPKEVKANCPFFGQVSAGIGLAVFTRSLGGSIAVSICQNVFEQKLRKNIQGLLPNLDVSVISGSGATNFIDNVQAALGGNQEELQQVIDLYNNAVVQVFLVALILAAISFPAAFLVEWKSVKREKREKNSNESNEETGKHEST
jgi:hypothetical protein